MADGGASLSTAGHGGVDRFSALHDDLLRHIITLLPIRYAARTAVLASRWRYLWRSNRLVLIDTDISEPAHDAVVPRVLANHLGYFHAVFLYDCRLASLDRELPDWPRLLADKRTEKLVLAYRWLMDQPNLARPLPADILRCDSLQELTLHFWTFPSGVEVLLPHLRILTMARIVISDRDLECLIAACPVLKSLGLFVNSSKHARLCSQSLIGCTIVGLPRVEEFTVTMVDTPLLERFHLFQLLNGVEIRITRAPNLRVLGYLDTRVQKLQTGNSVIASDTMVRASTVVPSVNILGLTVNFGVFANMAIPNQLRAQRQSLHIEEGIFSSADKVTEIKDELQCLQFPRGISAVLQVSPEADTALRSEKAFNLTVDDPFDC
ncbi:F-box/LRR-repeat protein 13-like [Hordeum vulgare subsp. vulgare]|uniref:F-box/LRR-repeat protein 13-like n=1 Tax=Hordeum vulgare subsp. vulgare TaxID=112509 RepID=UPI001D1A49C8|nr:F-box/LRR-repeat protein 13-like [Hordeum vulgare subsp. vulgare]